MYQLAWERFHCVPIVQVKKLFLAQILPSRRLKRL